MRLERARFSAENWNLLESALGHKIKPDLRNEIERLTDSYFATLQAEKSPASEDVLDILAKVESFGSKLLDELNSSSAACEDDRQEMLMVTEWAKTGSPPPVDEWEPRNYAMRYLRRHLRTTSVPRARETLEDLVSGCQNAKQTIEGLSYMGWQPGDAWRLAVGNLSKKFQEAGLPSTASRNVVASSAPFVRFIAAWQSLLPPEFRRHTHSDEALASGITRVWQIFVQDKPENAT
jgi:hypothetical protein